MDAIFQYTSLESLAMILKEKKIRFSNLCLLDDPLEKFIKIRNYDSSDHHLTYIRKNYGKFCFVSCWTYEKEESIAMWDMYGDRKKGVRIAMPLGMFDKNYNINSASGKNRSILSKKTIQAVQPEFIKVEYNRLDDPKITTDDWKVQIGNLGKYKMKDWEFQKECRFRLYAAKTKDEKNECWFIPPKGKSMDEMILKNPSTKEYIDFPIEEEAFKYMEIMEGPSITESKKVLLDALLNQFEIDNSKRFKSKYHVD